MMELFWTPEATQDRDEIYNYIEADNPAAALALDELFAEKAGRLVDHPGLGQAGAPAGLHVVSCGKQHCHWGIAGANGLAGRCLSLDMRR